MGVGFLVPWHAVITAVDYFGNLFPDNRVQFDVVIAYSIPNALSALHISHLLTFHFCCFSSSSVSEFSVASQWNYLLLLLCSRSFKYAAYITRLI